jgi:hypothetical protein
MALDGTPRNSSASWREPYNSCQASGQRLLRNEVSVWDPPHAAAAYLRQLPVRNDHKECAMVLSPAVPVRALAILGFTFLGAASSYAQTAAKNGCADCHVTTPAGPGSTHVETWDRSPHGLADVGCSACHGGDPTTFDPLQAHQGILPPTDRRSPRHALNIPAMCGKCHAGPFAAFQTSRHYDLLRTGNDEGPTCITCHGASDGRMLSAKALAARCSSCHGPKEVAPRAGRVVEVQSVYEELGAVREQLKLARLLIARVNDKKRRAKLTFDYEQTELAVRQAVEVGHKFVYDSLRSNLARAQDRTNALLASLANR